MSHPITAFLYVISNLDQKPASVCGLINLNRVELFIIIRKLIK